MLNSNLDLNITDFVTVGFEGLADTIDALGGIDLEITDEEMEYMNSYMEDMYDELGIDYEEVTDSGMQHLSGIQATAYCRIRYTEGDDFKRAQRQRTVLSLTMEKAKKANPLQLARAAGSVFATVNGESCVIPYYLTTNVITLHSTLFGQDDYEPSSVVQENTEIINSYVY